MKRKTQPTLMELLSLTGRQNDVRTITMMNYVHDFEGTTAHLGMPLQGCR